MANMGTIMAMLGLDDSRFKAGVNNAGKWSKQKFSVIGGAAAGAFAAAFSIEKMREVIEMANEFKIFAMQAGITAKQFQQINAVIERAGGDASDTVSIMLDLKRAMADARTGNKQWVSDFALFGITMDQIKKDDPVALFESLGKAVAKSGELTGEQVNALGRMMGEDTSARAIAAFRNNFEKSLSSINVMADETLDKLEKINAEIKKAQRESDIATAQEIARNKDLIIEATTSWEKIKREAIIGGAMTFNWFAKNIIEPSSDAMAEAIRFYWDKNWTKFDVPLKDASKEFKRREEIMGMIITPDKTANQENRSLQQEQLNTLKKIEAKIGPDVVMGL